MSSARGRHEGIAFAGDVGVEPLPTYELPAWISSNGDGKRHNPDRPSGLLH
jgi:hypothetical protein